ncbi:MAG: PAS domain S-box protein [Sulfuriferula multivorans]|uniref:histidine kinase n=1 Tax=Sulfuriferula multivorans TaxID=1559896 RepID=A0A7C9K1E8_9PROT|nr:PAS domain S-box protein [Sulfuriferula multivorans]
MLENLREGVVFALLTCLVCLGTIGPTWADKTSSLRLALSPTDKAWLTTHPIIRLGIDPSYAPYSFLDTQGKPQGVVSDFLAYLGPTLGVRFELVTDLDWPQLMAAVQARRVDAVATVVRLPERDAFLEFTSVYLPTPLVIMTRIDTPQLRSLQDLDRQSLVLVEGYSSSKQVLEQYPTLRPHYVPTALNGLRAVASGASDAYVGVLGVNTHLAAQQGITNLKVNAGFDMEVNGQRFGVRKDWPQLARILDQALASMPTQQKNAIFQQWMPLHAEEILRLSQPTLVTRLFPWLVGSMIVVVFGYLAILLWNRQLKRELARRQGELTASANRLKAAETIAHVGNWQYTVANGDIQWSDETYRIFGLRPQSQPFTYEWHIAHVHPDDRAAHDDYLQRMLESRPGEDIPVFRYRLVRADGVARTVSVQVHVEYDASGKPASLLGTLQDISDQVRAEEKLTVLNRLYRVLSGIDVAIIHLRDPQKLFEEACRIAVEVGGFRMAWLGMVGAGLQTVRPLAHAGEAGQYLENLHISLGEDEQARGPTGLALGSGQHIVCNDIAHDPHMAPWREAALALGYQASAAFPIRVGGQVRGAFNLYADRAGFFDEDELRLLDELAEDIGFALEFIEADRARDTLNRRMVDLLESMSDGFVSLDRNWCYQYVNRKAGEMFGRAPGDLLGKHIWTEFPEGVGQPFQKTYEQVMDGDKMVRMEDYYPPWDQWYENRIYPTLDGISIFFTDITERKKREEDLKRLHSILNALVEGSTDAIFVKNREGRYLIANQALAALLGRPVEAILDADDHALYSAESAERFQADDLRIMEEGIPHSYEETVNTADASYRYLTTKGPLIIDGEVCGVFGIARDITDRKQIETALVESESRLRLFIEHAPAALAMFDRDMCYLAVSRRWLTDYQLERSDILGESHYDVFPDLSEHWKAIHQRGMAGELVRNKQDRFERADGSTQWLSGETRPWFAADSSVGGIVIFSEDISERILVEQSLRESEGRFSATFEQAAVGIAMVSPEGRWMRVNQKMCDIVGYSEVELLSLTFQDITHPDDLNADLGYVRQMLVHEIDAYSMEKRYLRKDGSQVWVNLTVSLIWKDNEAPDYFISVIEDINSRKLGEAALQESETRFRHLFEQNPVPMLVYERGSLHMLAVNAAFLRHYGYSHDEILAMRLTDLYPDEEKESISEVAASLKGLAYVGEWHHLTKTGSRIIIEARSHDIEFEGRTARVAVITDITERKQAEQILRDSEAHYRSLIELAPFPAVITRVRDGILIYGNHRAEVQYGISREQGIGQPAEEFYEDRSERMRFLEPLQKTGKVDDLEVRMRTADGRPFWALVSASIVEFDHEPAIFTAINDITERKQAEAALQEQETFFRLIAENIGDMVAVLDLEGRRLYNSPSYCALFGDPKTLVGTDSFAEIHPDDRDEVRRVFMDTVRTGKGKRINFRFVLADGTVRNIESQGGVIHGVNGQIDRVVVVSRDITERMHMEEEVHQLNVALEERVSQRTAELAMANKELETFTYSVSHDLKAPLRGIDGYSRLLLEDYQSKLDKPGIELLNNVRVGVMQMSQLIDDLLTYSRMERRSLQGRPLDISSLMTGVLDTLQADIQAQGMVVETSLQGLTAQADPEGLAIVLRNLVDNALKFTRDSHPPHLSVSGVKGEKSITLKFADNGIGFDMQFHDRIFEIFQRLQRAEDYPGTGVGLAIVFKAMQRMGGRVWAESAPGQGATFYLELPQ